MKEIWKDIIGYEGLYQVSDQGRVRSLDRIIGKREHTGQLLKQSKSRCGYMRVGLNNRGKKFMYIHRLVAISFIDNPKHKPQVNHIDGNKTNNNASNLEWNTAKENIVHARKNNLMRSLLGEKHQNTNLTNEIVLELRRFHEKYNLSKVEVAYLFDMKPSTCGQIIRKERWKHI